MSGRTGEKARKATFALDPSVLRGLDDAVADGAAPSKNALVEGALRRELELIRREARRRRWKEAAEDPLFLRDIRQVASDFEAADAEAARLPQ